MFSALLLGLCCLGAGSYPLQGAETKFDTRRPELDRTLIRVMTGLGAEPTDCKARMLTQPLVHALCGNAPAAMKRQGDELRAEVGRLLVELGPAEMSKGGWQIDRGLSEAGFMLRGVRVTAVVKPKTAEVSLMYVPDATACLSPGAREGAVDASSMGADEGFEQPVLEFRADPDYPEEARIEPRNGKVLLGYRVEASGEVSEVCAAMSDDAGIGHAFARSAVAAWKRNRFKPARLNGEPVASVGTSILTFEIAGLIPGP